MAYSKEFHDRARLEIRQRRDNAELTAKQHRIEMTEKYPEFQFIEEMLAKTGAETEILYVIDDVDQGQSLM